jgi:FMN phosphatase YigB (HAD superfamily)
MIKAVLFDFYGVLYPDTFWGLANQFLPDRGKETQQQLHDLIKRSDLSMIDQESFWAETAQLFGTSPSELIAARSAFGGVDTVLLNRIKDLKNRGLQVGIISNVGSGAVEEALGDHKSLFDVMILSGDTGFIKPDPQVYELALERLGLEAKDCLFIDDIPRNVRGAEAVGMNAVHYEGLPDYDLAIARLMPNMNDETLV